MVRIVLQNKEPLSKHNMLSYYGACLVEYHGEGNLTLANGQELKCEYDVGQLTDGNILLLCKILSPYKSMSISASGFKGTTSEGFRVCSDENMLGIGYLPDPSSSGSFEAFCLRELSIQMNENELAEKIHFGITNFEFIGTEPACISNSHLLILPLELQGLKFSIIPVSSYNNVIKRVKTLKIIDVTCEAVVDLSNSSDIDQLKEIVSHLCYYTCRSFIIWYEQMCASSWE